MNPHPAKRHLLPEDRRYADGEHCIGYASCEINFATSRFAPFAPWEKGWG